jgi:hypothetical protein
MKKSMAVVGVLLMVAFSLASAATISMKLSGPGAVNDSTIKAGEKVSVDMYFSTKDTLKAFSSGFKLYSKDIKQVVHVKDTVNGLGKTGDARGWNGWNDKSQWDFNGVWLALKNWDGALPDTIGFAAAVVKKIYAPHESKKVLSFEMIVPEAGTLTLDSTFFYPGMSWKVVLPPPVGTTTNGEAKPIWKGPYTWRVVK